MHDVDGKDEDIAHYHDDEERDGLALLGLVLVLDQKLVAHVKVAGGRRLRLVRVDDMLVVDPVAWLARYVHALDDR